MRRARAAVRGYTLSEVMVVLGVLVTVAALALPSLRNALGDSRLRSAGKQIRTELAKARLRAMQSGTSQRFRYQAGQNRFEIAPAMYDPESELAAAAPATGSAFAAEPQAADELPQPEDKAVVRQLPEGVSFEPSDERAELAVDEEGWSLPIVFHPNGRTSDAEIRLRGEGEMVVDVKLRGLTGSATVGKPRHDEAIQ